MKCGYPTDRGDGLYVNCNQCMPCRINKKREWTGRIMLEDRHTLSRSAWLTLTFDDEHLPPNGYLTKDPLQRWLKRLRKDPKFTPTVRYFACGEYGDRLGRPHYHIILFGTDPWDWEEYLRESWKEGNIKVGELNHDTAQYTVGYTAKKLTKAGEPALQGKPPEFFTCSTRPRIGTIGISQIAKQYRTREGTYGLAAQGDISGVFRYNNRLYPLSYTDRKILREDLGVTPRSNSTNDWELTDGTETEEQAKHRILKTRGQLADKLYRQSKSATYSRRSL